VKITSGIFGVNALNFTINFMEARALPELGEALGSPAEVIT
jgi:hypothetical protein